MNWRDTLDKNVKFQKAEELSYLFVVYAVLEMLSICLI